MNIDIAYHPVHGVPPSFVARDASLLRSLGVDVRLHSVVTPVDIRRLLFDHPDMVIFWFPGTARLYGHVPRPVRAPYVVMLGGSDVRATKGSAAWRRTHGALRRADAAVFVAEHLLVTALRNGHVLPRSVHVCPTWVPEDVFVPLRKRPKSVAFVGPLDGSETRAKTKGYDRYLDRVAPEDRVEIGTTGPFLSESEVAVRLGTSEFVACLSRAEGLPNSLIEGMLCGCIPIVSDEMAQIREVRELVGYDPLTPEKARSRALAMDLRTRRLGLWRTVLELFES